MIKRIIITVALIFLGSAAVAGAWEASKPVGILLALVLLGILFLLWRRLFQKRPAEKPEEPAQPPEPPKPQKTPEQKVAEFLENSQDATYHYTDVGIFRPGDMELAEPVLGDYVLFRDDPENPYDEKALMVTTTDREPLGYMNKGKLRDMVRDYNRRPDDAVSGMITDAEDLKIALALRRGFMKDFWEEMDRG